MTGSGSLIAVLGVVCLVICGVQGNVIERSSDDSYCYNTDQNPTRLYGSKTPYRAVHGDAVAADGSLPGCQVAQVWQLSRHGSRYAGSKRTNKMIELLGDLKNRTLSSNTSRLCQEDRVALEGWSQRLKPEDKKNLAEEGKRELRATAQRLKGRFPSIFSTPYSNASYQFRHTEKSRTRDSARAFVESLFGSIDGVQIDAPSGDDTLLRFYDYCPLYKQTKDAVDEPKKFEEGPEMRDIAAKVTHRLGLTEPLTVEQMLVVYDACRFDYMLFNDAPWCSAFDSEMLAVPEYVDDLEGYWEDMYGHEINYKQACPLVTDVLASFDLASCNGGPVSVNRFAHSMTLQSFYARVGLFRPDTPLLASNLAQQGDRVIRRAVIGPMASHMELVLYNCGETKQVKAWVNDIEAEIPQCPSPCNLDTLRQAWQPFVDGWDLDEICRV